VHGNLARSESRVCQSKTPHSAVLTDPQGCTTSLSVCYNSHRLEPQAHRHLDEGSAAVIRQVAHLCAAFDAATAVHGQSDRHQRTNRQRWRQRHIVGSSQLDSQCSLRVILFQHQHQQLNDQCLFPAGLPIVPTDCLVYTPVCWYDVTTTYQCTIT